jgi:hypothetical protein
VTGGGGVADALAAKPQSAASAAVQSRSLIAAGASGR